MPVALFIFPVASSRAWKFQTSGAQNLLLWFFFLVQQDNGLAHGQITRGTKTICHLKEDQFVLKAWCRICSVNRRAKVTWVCPSPNPSRERGQHPANCGACQTPY